ncbi:hypothetical protein GCM10009106_12070 [Sphingomonas japonica]
MTILGFTGVVFLSMIATAWTIGVPVRSLAAAGLMIVLAILCPVEAAIAVRRLKWFMRTALVVTAIGMLASALSGDGVWEIIQAAVEISVQALVLMVLTAIVAEICGSRAVFMAFVMVIGVSAVVAVAQFVGVDGAWGLRGAIASLQGDALVLPNDGLDGSGIRAVGLSYSKTILGAQICLALAAYYLMFVTPQPDRRSLRLTLSQPRVAIGLVLLCIVAFASGNRSPILGGAIFFLLIVSQSKPRLFTITLVGIATVALLAEPVLSLLRASGSRIFETSDNSSLIRGTLTHYGLMLFLDNPLGYGLSFDPTLHAAEFVARLHNDPNKYAIFRYPLHNYLFSIINIYGVLILGVAFWVWDLIRRNLSVFIIFTPYVIHIMFHNSGPFYQNEIFFWLVAGALPKLVDECRREARRALQGPSRSGEPNRGPVDDRDQRASGLNWGRAAPTRV